MIIETDTSFAFSRKVKIDTGAGLLGLLGRMVRADEREIAEGNKADLGSRKAWADYQSRQV